MQTLNFSPEQPGESRTILCLGSHSDDIEIGCGGSILRLIQEDPYLRFYWVVLGAQGMREAEARTSAGAFLEGASHAEVVVKGFRDGFFPYHGGAVKEYFEELKKELTPDIIFTHYRHDLHQDHRLINELTWNTWRDHLILEYEIPKYDGDFGVPNFFIHLDESICDRKVELLMEHFQTQENKHWFSSDTFLSVLRLRGIESKSPGRYAEAFYGRKIAF